MTRWMSGIVAVALLALLGGCVPSPPTLDVRIDDPTVDLPSILAGEATPGGEYGSGILEVFDDVAELVPGLDELRPLVEADEATVAERFADAADDAPAARAVSPRGHGSSVAADDDVAVGAFLLGTFSGIILDAVASREDAADIPVGGSDRFGELGVTRTDERNVTVTMSQKAEHSSGDATSTTDYETTVGGAVCPGPDGAFDATITVRHTVSGSAGGVSSGETQTLTGRLTGTLGENAFPEAVQATWQQKIAQTRPDGREIMVETRQATSGSYPTVDAFTGAPVQLLGQSEGADASLVQQLAKRGQGRAANLVYGQLAALVTYWRTGGCVRIDASAPASVAPSSVTDIPTAVNARLDGSSVSAKVSISLEGAESVSTPTLRTPSRFSYAAPDEGGSTATIRLVAESRQGAHELSLTISTNGGHYAISGGSGPFAGSGEWCDGASAFSVSGGDVTTFFELGGLGTFEGALQYSGGNMSGGWAGGGSWSATVDDDGRPTVITAQYAGQFYAVTGGGVGTPHSQSITFALTPKETCDAR